ncbi:aromatic amino acid lyase [Streptomyces sp. NPDC023588]|uniref:aromatic amino acid lyase n=1 Tax=Streptomyces sp. NPDC023588 TaxID=3154907 RepID=UPI0033F63275
MELRPAGQPRLPAGGSTPAWCRHRRQPPRSSPRCRPEPRRQACCPGRKDGQEDHNTMAMASVRNMHENLDRFETALAVLLMMDAQGIDLIGKDMRGLSLGTGTAALHRGIRRTLAPLKDDRWMSPDVERMTGLVRSRALEALVDRTSGRLLHSAGH